MHPIETFTGRGWVWCAWIIAGQEWALAHAEWPEDKKRYSRNVVGFRMRLQHLEARARREYPC